MTTKRSDDRVVHFFYAGEVARLSGLSKYMVDYLCRHGILTASESRKRGYGKRRRFNFTDVLLAKSINELLDNDISVRTLRKGLLNLRDLLHSDTPATLRDTRIVIRGRVPYLCQPEESPLDLLARGQMAFSFVLEVEDLWKRADALQSAREEETRARILRALRIRRERLA